MEIRNRDIRAVIFYRVLGVFLSVPTNLVDCHLGGVLRALVHNTERRCVIARALNVGGELVDNGRDGDGQGSHLGNWWRVVELIDASERGSRDCDLPKEIGLQGVAYNSTEIDPRRRFITW
ncbi:hypothetical protein [Emiliania huxleyi virus 99B1]|nr:hypothetical protein EhVM1_000280 [Emiliania huxleyi virus M1]CAZ69602.1 hypothetical protein [Emiliania huxleyi virus 99B1]